MARGYTTRKLQVHALHATSSEGAVDYPALFAQLARTSARMRQTASTEAAIALPILSLRSGVVTFVAYKGPIGQYPLIFNRNSSTERLEPLASGEIVATRTHGVIDVERREAIIEYNHSGAKAPDIASVLQSLAERVTRAEWFQFELNPKADQTFLEDLARFRSVKVASIKMARPNPNWTDYESHLTSIAADSDARVIEVTVSAGRQGAINTIGGLVDFIRQAAGARLPPLKGAQVSGYREGEDAATTISLSNHIEHQRVEVKLTPEGHVETSDIQRKLLAYLRSRQEQEGNE
jgi:hypothetical protein